MNRDPAEIQTVLQTVISRASLPELLEPLHPAEESMDLLAHTGTDEEAEVTLVNEDGETVATLYVDILSDPVNDWTIKLRGWKLMDDVASV